MASGMFDSVPSQYLSALLAGLYPRGHKMAAVVPSNTFSRSDSQRQEEVFFPFRHHLTERKRFPATLCPSFLIVSSQCMPLPKPV